MTDETRSTRQAAILDIPLSRDVFMRELIRELAGTLEDVVDLDEASGYISVVGQSIVSNINDEYRHALSVNKLNRKQVADVLVDLKQRIAGSFYVIEGDDNKIVTETSLKQTRGGARYWVCKGDIHGLSLASRLTEAEEVLLRYLRICGGSYQPMPGRITVKRADGDPVRHALSGACVDIETMGDSGGLVMLQPSESAGVSAHTRFATLNATINQLTQQVRARRQAEALLEAEKHVLEMIVNGEPIAKALGQFALAVEEHTAGMLMSILLVDDDKRLRHAAASNFPALS